MNAAALCIGASIVGWLIPEFVFMLAPHADNFKRVPFGINLLCMVGFGLIAYGVRA